MTSEIALKHEFVEFIPDELEQGTVYVSIRFATASHLRLRLWKQGRDAYPPDRLDVAFRRQDHLLEPLNRNWSFPCQSHYYIRKNALNGLRNGLASRSSADGVMTATRNRTTSKSATFKLLLT